MNKKHIEKRIVELENIIRKRGGLLGRNPGTPSELYLSFLEHTLAFDDSHKGAQVKGIDMKTEIHAHLELPSESELDDHSLTEKLHALVELLASFHINLCSTDHLTDRELYNTLLGQLLDKPFDLSTFTPNGSEYIDLCNDPDLFEKFYDDPDAKMPANRDHWIKVLVKKYQREPVPEFKSPKACAFFRALAN